MNELLKSNFISSWEKYFPGAPLPIAFFYSNDLHNALPALEHHDHRCIIADLTRVFRGDSLAFNAENMGCRGGSRYCGFSKLIMPDFKYFLSSGIPGKMDGERYKKDPETVTELMKNTPLLNASSSWLIVKPFEMLGPDDEPEAVLFFATPDVIAGLFTLANYDRTDLYGVKTPFSAGCGSVIQYPRIENKRENPDCILGMFDSSARPYVKANLLSFAIPMKRFETLVGYMDDCFLTTDTWKVMGKRISGKAERI